MKIEIYGEPKEPEKVVRLKLFEKTDGSVELAAVNKEGYRVTSGSILLINESGVFLRSCVSPDIGLPRDESGCVKVTNP